MTIQVGVPGAAGGGGGGIQSLISQGGGTVRVETDGSISIEPVDESVITIRSPSGAVVDSPRVEFRDSQLRATLGIARDNTDVLNDAVANDFFINGASRLLLGTAGQVRILMVSDTIRFNSSTIWASTGPHAFGTTNPANFYQFSFEGNATIPSSSPRKFQIRGTMTGESGAQSYAGLTVAVSLATQSESEQVNEMWGVNFEEPGLTNNLGGGNDIVQAATVRIRNAPTGALSNFALLVEAGLTKLALLHAADAGPHTFGVATRDTTRQFEFAGNYTADGSLPTKYLWEGSLTTLSGAGEVFGHRVDLGFITPTEVADIDLIALMSLEAPGITNNLTGDILEAVTFQITGAPSGGLDNFAFRVNSGLSRLNNLEHAGTLLGFYSTAGVARPTGVAVTDAAIHAALVTLGLITA